MYCSPFKEDMKKEYADLHIDVINSCVVEETSVDGLRRLDQVIGMKPNVVIVGFGMNDWIKGVEKETFRKNLEIIIEELDRRGVRVIVMTMNPAYNGNRHISELLIPYDKIIKKLASEKKVQLANICSLWIKELPNIKDDLYNEIHPNGTFGNTVISKALMRVVPRSQTVVVWAFNGIHAFCNYQCEYCYVPTELNKGHYSKGDINGWHDAFKNTFGSRKLVFYLSFGEPMYAKSFYDVLDMIASEPNWHGHITSNLSFPLNKLVESKLVKEGRLNINASFHPTQTSINRFLDKLLFLRKHGIESPVIIVMWPPNLKDFPKWFEIFNGNNFLVHVRRFRGWYGGKFYPKAYTEEERQFIAKYCDDGTIKYMLNDFGVDFRGKATYAGMYYLLVDNDGNVQTSPDCQDKYLGNIFEENVNLFTDPSSYGLDWNGSVNGISSFLELGYRELEENFVLSFARQGGVYHTENGIYYKNMHTNFEDPEIRLNYNFPSCKNCEENFLNKAKNKLLIEYWKWREFMYRKIYPRLVVSMNKTQKLIKGRN